jgi:hypothetical protein
VFLQGKPARVIRSKEINYRLTATTAHTARNNLGVSREEQRKRGFSFRMERGRNDFLLHKFIKFIVSRLRDRNWHLPRNRSGGCQWVIEPDLSPLLYKSKPTKVIEDRSVLLPNNVSNI